MMRPTLFVSVILVAVVLSGCSREAQAYEELSALRSAVSSAGVACERVDPGPDAELVRDSGTCVGSEVSLYLFDDAGDLDDWRKVGTRLGPTLIGPNWAVTGDARELDRIGSEVGGEVV
jgi:hypothetical protein